MDRTLFITLAVYSAAVLLTYLLFVILSPFQGTLVWAAAIGVITYPLYERLLLRCKGREVSASGLMILAVLMAGILPLIGLILALSREASQAYKYLESAAAGGRLPALEDVLLHPSVAPWLETMRPLTSSLGLELDAMLLPAAKRMLTYMLNFSTGILKDVLGFFAKLVLMLITLFFIYRDGVRFLRRFWQVVAIGEQLRAIICETITRVLRAVVYGIFLTCLVQGALGGLGFWVAGLPSPFLFGALMAIGAAIPLVGTAVVWLPGAIYLLVKGQTLYGVLLLGWGALVVSSIDNVLRPLLISGKAKLPILVIILGVLGGFLTFGLSGVVAGPVILALVMVFFEVYRVETAFSDQT
jgi:predicted PurR-regulated permease PerM